MNISQRIVVLNCCADVSKDPKIKKLFTETALSLQGITEQFNRLAEAAIKTVQTNHELSLLKSTLIQQGLEEKLSAAHCAVHSENKPVHHSKRNRWIHVTEALPTTPYEVLITDNEGFWLGYYLGGTWYQDHEPADSVVTHWMEIPEFPQT